MKKHSAANRLNVGSTAMHACYSHVDERAMTDMATTPASLVSTPGGGPPVPGAADDALARAFGVRVTGRAPAEVKGKGTMAMYWVDAMSDDATGGTGHAAAVTIAAAIAAVRGSGTPVRVGVESAGTAASVTRRDVMLRPVAEPAVAGTLPLAAAASAVAAAAEARYGVIGAATPQHAAAANRVAFASRALTESFGESFRVRVTTSKVLELGAGATSGPAGAALAPSTPSAAGAVAAPTPGSTPAAPRRRRSDASAADSGKTGEAASAARAVARRPSAVSANEAWLGSQRAVAAAAAAAAPAARGSMTAPITATTSDLAAWASSEIVRIARAGETHAAATATAAQGEAPSVSDADAATILACEGYNKACYTLLALCASSAASTDLA